MKDPILQIKNLKKEYGENESKMMALDDVSMDFYKGELVCILGSSGSGKSTLLNMIGAIDSPTSGDVLYCKESILNLTEKKRTQYRREHIGFVFQSFNLVMELSALENVSITASFKNTDAKEWLRMVGLEDKMHLYPSQMSGGQQQRVSIARALAKQSDILLCDEPTGALDSISGKEILKVLYDVARVQNKLVILVTHTKEIASMADRILVMKNGKIIEEIKNEHPRNPEDIEW